MEMWKSKLGVLAITATLSWSVVAQAAVIMTENFESGLGAWTVSAGTSAAVSAPPATPPDAPGSTASFLQGDGLIARIGRSFTTSTAATSFKLTYYVYSNSTASSQRYYGQLSNGTAGTPGTGSGGFARIAANNDAASKWDFLYSNGSTQTVVTPTTISVGWHLMQLTVTPGVAGVGSYVYQIDNNAPVTQMSTASILVPTNVQLGQNVSNGTAGAPDTSAWFDSIKVEQFAPAAVKPTVPVPPDGNAAVGINDDLAWTSGANSSFFDVFFDVGLTPTTLVSGNQAGSTFTLPTLLPNTTYSWRIDAKNVLGDATTGDIWTFTTTPEPATLVFLGLGSLLLGRKRANRA